MDGADIFTRKKNDNLVLDPQRTAEYLRDHGYISHRGRMYEYMGKGYRVTSKTEMMSKVYRLVSELKDADSYVVFPSTALINDAIRRWQGLWETYPFDPDAVREDLRYDGHLVSFRNGLYNVDRDILAPHTKDALVMERFDFDYDPSVTGDQIEDAYRDILDGGEYDTFFAALGRTLFSDGTPFMVVIHGGYQTGKSFLYHTLDRICTQGTISYIAYRDIDLASTPAYVEDKVANMDSFVSFEGRHRSQYKNRLVPLITGQTLSAHEKYGPVRQIVNSTPLWFKTDDLFYRNNFPSELSDRMYCVHCTHVQMYGQGRCDMLDDVHSRQWVVNEALRTYRMYGQRIPNASGEDTVRMYFDCLGLDTDEEIRDHLDGRNTVGTYRDYVARVGDFMQPLSRLQFLGQVRDRYGMGIKHKSVRVDGGFSSINVFFKVTP